MQTRDGVAEVNGTSLYYEVAPGDPLVLVHGSFCDTTYWDDQFEPFSQHYTVVRYDMRGFGKSANPTEQPYAHFDDLRALLEHLGISRAHLLGHSFGSRIVLDFALKYPEMVRSLILFAGAPSGYEIPPDVLEEAQKVFIAASEAVQKSGVRAGNEIVLRVPHLRATMQNPRAAPRITRVILNYPGWHWLNQDPETWLDQPAVGRLDQIKVPTCIIGGEKDFAGTLLGSALMHQNITHAQNHVVLGTGHAVNMEAPGQFNEIVLDFLAQA